MKGNQKVHHNPGRAQLADLNTKSRPFGRLQQLRKLWGIEEIQKKKSTRGEESEDQDDKDHRK